MFLISAILFLNPAEKLDPHDVVIFRVRESQRKQLCSVVMALAIATAGAPIDSLLSGLVSLAGLLLQKVIAAPIPDTVCSLDVHSRAPHTLLVLHMRR